MQKMMLRRMTRKIKFGYYAKSGDIAALFNKMEEIWTKYNRIKDPKTGLQLERNEEDKIFDIIDKIARSDNLQNKRCQTKQPISLCVKVLTHRRFLVKRAVVPIDPDVRRQV